MSALNTPGQDDLQHQQQQDPQQQQLQVQPPLTADLQPPPTAAHNGETPPVSEGSRKPKAPSVRRACAACHAGKTRCSEVLPCQSCLKRGLGPSCAYPDPDADVQQNQSPAQVPPFAPPPPMPYPPPMHGLGHPPYYDYSGTFSGASASTSTFRPNKRPRNLTEEEAAAITRNFTRGAFFVGQSEPIRIDPRLPVRLTLAEGDQVHFLIGETALQ